jgi:hypothetical protein
MTQRDRLTHLVVLGSDPDDPLLQPRVERDHSFALEEGEKVGYEGEHKVTVSFFNERAGMLGNKKEWETVVPFEKPARVSITTRRVLYTWPRWKSENSGGSFFERRVVTALMESGEGKMTMAGHIRHPWVWKVWVTKPKGLLRKESSIRFDLQDGKGIFSVTIQGFDPDHASLLAQAFTASVARRRLRECQSIKDDALAVLHALADKRADPGEKDWAWVYQVPAGMKVGFEFSGT